MNYNIVHILDAILHALYTLTFYIKTFRDFTIKHIYTKGEIFIMASVNMNFIFILSVILKGIGAVLEIALQILLTKLIGLSGYGSYSTWISGADLLFWAFSPDL